MLCIDERETSNNGQKSKEVHFKERSEAKGDRNRQRERNVERRRKKNVKHRGIASKSLYGSRRTDGSERGCALQSHIKTIIAHVAKNGKIWHCRVAETIVLERALRSRGIFSPTRSSGEWLGQKDDPL